MTTLEANSNRIAVEEKFHDQWAQNTDTSELDVVNVNTTCTSPELRLIHATLSPIHGKRVLDVGCGLGEASVYFAMQGAHVTSTDLSSGMLECTQKLATRYGVDLMTHQSTAETLNLPDSETFDVIYVGNLFHHVHIEETIVKLKRHLKPDGVLVSWDPVAYNPLINIYRHIATDTRTPDEHPFKRRDLAHFQKHFSDVKTRWFWFSTLIIFVLMAVVQRRNPNKERYWKKVVDEGQKWRWLYEPLEKLDTVLLTLFPFLRWWCWNVVVFAKGPR